MPTITPPSEFPLYGSDEKRCKIALIAPGSYGDNINSTLMLKPLFAKYNKPLIDVYSSSLYGSAFENNHYVNKLIVYGAYTKNDALHLVHVVPNEIKDRGYDIICNPHPMINPDKWTSIKHPELGTNLILAWVRALENLDVPYDLPLETILNLTAEEVGRVNRLRHSIPSMGSSRNVLMEVSGESGQTFWDHRWTMAVADHLLSGNTNLFISRRDNGSDVEALKQRAPNRVHFVGNLTIRECAELFNYCNIFFSVSSGLSNACNTNWCKKDIKWVETTSGDGATSAPIRKDGKLFWHVNDLKQFLSMLKNNGI